MSVVRELATRERFVDAVRSALDAAGIEYAFLHGWDDTGERDSDVDIVVRREHLAAVEAVARWGKLGALVQRFDYDIPWSRYYVFATGEAARSFRQLDVACDPYGISWYGMALSVALEHAERVDGTPVLTAPALTLYLATKRARKGLRGSGDVHAIQKAFALDPAGAEALLASVWLSAGREVADALRRGHGLSAALGQLEAAIKRSRRQPVRVARRALFESRRACSRLARPTGLVVRIAGPDGAGKTTVANALEASLEGAFRRTARLHLGPGLLPPPGRLLRRTAHSTSAPQSQTPSGRGGSVARVGYLALDATLGWLPRVWEPRARSTLVLVERGWDDLLVDPKRYRLGAGARLARALARILPGPDLTLLLSGDSTAIHLRKPELDVGEVERQLREWRKILATRSERRVEVDTTVENSADAAAEAVIEHLRASVGDLEAFDVARACLGQPSAKGTQYSIVVAGGRPRWLLPRRLGASGPMASHLYRPASLRHLLGVAATTAAQRIGGPGLRQLSVDPRIGVAPEVAAALELRSVELACLLPTDANRCGRATFAALSSGHPVAIVKAARGGSVELDRERQVLQALEAAELDVLVVPGVLAAFPWRGLDILVLSIVDGGGRTNRAIGKVEREALLEIPRLTSAVEGVLGTSDGNVLVHGDFCGWNTAVVGQHALATWDWEWARLGLPLEDYFHWQTQRLVHFGAGSVAQLVTSALSPPKEVQWLADHVGLSKDRLPAALSGALRAGLKNLSPNAGTARQLRLAALRHLEGRA